MTDKKEPMDPAPETSGGKSGIANGSRDLGSAQPVTEIIEAFGGLRPMAGKLKVAVSTVQGWKERDSIPAARHEEIAAAAKAHGIALDAGILAASDHMARGQSAGGQPPEAGNAGARRPDAGKQKDNSERSGKPATEVRSAIPSAGDAAKAGSTRSGEQTAGRKVEDAGPPVERKSGGWLSGFLLGVIVLALVLAGGIYTRNFWLPLVESLPVVAGGGAPEPGGAEANAARIEELETKLAALEERMLSLPEAPVVEMTALEQAIAATDERIDVLDQTLGQLLAEGVILAPSDDAYDGEDGVAQSADSESAVAAGAAERQEIARLRDRIEEISDQLADVTAAGAAASATGGETSDEGSRDEAGAAAAERLAELDTRVEEMERKFAELPDTASRLNELDSRLAEAEQDVEALPGLESRLNAELAALSETMPKGPSQEAGDAAMFLALLQLREALRGSGPYESELALVDELAAGDTELQAALEPLAERAASGIPGLPNLRASFGEMAGKAVAAARGGEEGDWVANTLRKVSEVVTIRPVGLVEGDDAGAVLARAEVKLEAGDLAATVTELEGLSGAAAEVAAPWLKDAQARLDADTALSRLASRAAALIGLGG